MSAVSLGVQDSRKVVVSQAARETHMHVIGASGQGKSYFLEHLIRQDILSGAGVCVIDPHGTLYDHLVAWLAEHQIDRFRHIHLFNPSEDNWAVGFNPLCAGDADPTVRVGAMVNACLKVWGGGNIADTPRLAKCLRSVFYVLAHHRLSLLEAKQLTSYTAAERRKELTRDLPNPAFLQEWEEFNAYRQQDFAAYFESTNSRLLPFIASPILSRVVGQTENVIDFVQCMNERHIVLVNLATKDRMDLTNAQLIGAMLFADLFTSATRRSEAEGSRNPFYCYVDECADFITDDIARMLDQTRKYGLHLILAHQRLEQLRQYGDNLYNAVMAGAQSKVMFKVDDDETAETLSRFLFRKLFDLEEPKRVLDKPVAVGQERVWLSSESTTRASGDASSEASSRSSGQFQGISVAEAERLSSLGNEMGSSITAGKSEGMGSSSGWAWAISTTSSVANTSGSSETLASRYEIMPTAVYSLEEQIHKGIVTVRSLPRRTAIGYLADDGRPFPFSTLAVRAGAVLPSQIGHFVDRTHRKSRFTTEAAVVEHQIASRYARATEETAVTDSDDPFMVSSSDVVK